MADTPKAMPPAGFDRSTLATELLSASNSRGGWAYYPGKGSRLEPTAWALLALGAPQPPASTIDDSHRDFLRHCQRPDGWLVENSGWPVNIGFNALVALVWLYRPELAGREAVQRLVDVFVSSKGVQVPPSPSFVQDNSLQGWSWTADTFSWVEPTAWGTFALKKAVRAGFLPEATGQSRIHEAERLLFDRCCHDGGWNFGNANVMGKDLFPHVPTTAVALLALQDRRDHSAVTRSLAFLEAHWTQEQSLYALGLSLICLTMYGRPVATLEEQLHAHVTNRPRDVQGPTGPRHTALPFGSLHGCAVALCALSLKDYDAAFRI